MKISAQEEYGIRCLLQLGRRGSGRSATIPEISEAEGLSREYVAKLMRILRRSGLVRSVRGQAGGYVLARPLAEITVAEALSALGGRLWDAEFCRHHPGRRNVCSHSPSCTVRNLWQRLQGAVDDALEGVTLQDLLEDSGPQQASASGPFALLTLS